MAVLEMCRSLNRRGIRCLLASTNADGAGRNMDVPLGQTIEYEGVPTILFPRQVSEPVKYSRPFARWLLQHVRDFDVVHIHGVFLYPCFAAARACRRDGVPYIVRPFGTLDPWSLRQKRVRKRLLWILVARKMLKKAAAVHYTTGEERRLAEAPLKLSRGVVIPLGVDNELFENAASGEGADEAYAPVAGHPYVLLLSRLDPKKGIELVIDGFAALASEGTYEDWRLVIAGDGEPRYVEALKRRAREATAEGRILFPGWLDGVEKRTALGGASVFALASYQENFGLAVVEAMARGVPVLVSDQVNLVAEIREAGAGWIVPVEPMAIRTVLARVFSSREERVRRGRAGRDLASRRFRWSVVTEELRGLYCSLRPSGPS